MSRGVCNPRVAKARVGADPSSKVNPIANINLKESSRFGNFGRYLNKSNRLVCMCSSTAG